MVCYLDGALSPTCVSATMNLMELNRRGIGDKIDEQVLLPLERDNYSPCGKISPPQDITVNLAHSDSLSSISSYASSIDKHRNEPRSFFPSYWKKNGCADKAAERSAEMNSRKPSPPACISYRTVNILQSVIEDIVEEEDEDKKNSGVAETYENMLKRNESECPKRMIHFGSNNNSNKCWWNTNGLSSLFWNYDNNRIAVSRSTPSFIGSSSTTLQQNCRKVKSTSCIEKNTQGKSTVSCLRECRYSGISRRALCEKDLTVKFNPSVSVVEYAKQQEDNFAEDGWSKYFV